MTIQKAESNRVDSCGRGCSCSYIHRLANHSSCDGRRSRSRLIDQVAFPRGAQAAPLQEQLPIPPPDLSSFHSVLLSTLHSLLLLTSTLSSLLSLPLLLELKRRRNHDVLEAFGPPGHAPGKSSCIIPRSLIACRHSHPVRWLHGSSSLYSCYRISDPELTGLFLARVPTSELLVLSLSLSLHPKMSTTN